MLDPFQVLLLVVEDIQVEVVLRRILEALPVGRPCVVGRDFRFESVVVPFGDSYLQVFLAVDLVRRDNLAVVHQERLGSFRIGEVQAVEDWPS
jgi:hypothetical protein